MRRITILFFFFLTALGVFSQAAPKWAKKARNAVFSIVTYDK